MNMEEPIYEDVGQSPFEESEAGESTGSGCKPCSCVIMEMDKPLVNPGAILISKVHNLKEGSPLIGDIKLGKFLGAGMQARVYDLVKADGKSTGKVIKIAHSDAGHALINAVWIGLEREWSLGSQLRVALQESDGSLPGFMKVCDAIVTSSGTKKDGGPRKVHFAGMILEKLHGWEVFKRISTPEFHNIHYVREMLFQVLSALDKAQREVGFFHADMGMRNIMETYPRLYEHSEDDPGATEADEVEPPKPEECKTCGARGVTVDRVSGTPGTVKWPRPTGNCNVVIERPGFTCNADGSKMPLGPYIEFKIIDYGVSAFDDLLAQTTGGFKGRENYRRMRSLFDADHITLGSTSKSSMVELETGTGAIPENGVKKRVHLMPTRLRNRFKVQAAPKGTTPIPSPPSPNHLRKPSPDSVAERFSVASSSVGDAGDGCQDELSRQITARMLHASMTARKASAAEITAPQPKMGPVEVMYRHFWKRKGDVFHLLLGLAIALDDRVWPKEDEEDVMLFASLVHHVTGVHIHAAFASESDTKAKGVFGKGGGFIHLKKTAKKTGPYGMRAPWYTKFRRLHMMLKAHWAPFNSGLTAGEALTNPFFGGGAPPRAKLPVCVEAAFPRS